MTTRHVQTRDQRTRFFEKVSVHLNGCWIWEGSRSKAGYGTFNLGRRGDGYVLAHRYTYEMIFGPIPVRMELDHRCRVTFCCNPWHLEVVTRRTNWLRSADPRAHAHLRGTCIKGHPQTPENCYKYNGKIAYCKVCQREARRKRA